MPSVRHRGSVLFVAAALAALTAASTAGDGTPALFGFSLEESARQRSLEQRFDGALNPADLRAWLQNLSSAANHVGAPHDKANAEFVRDLFRQWGWDAQIEIFEVLYPTLRHHTLELLAPTRFVANLTEPPIEGDTTSARTDGMAPYNVQRAGVEGVSRGNR